jgi:hypothetical protein
MIRIYRHTVLGPDQRVGRIDPRTGKVFVSRVGPDKYIGRVNFESGKVYRVLVGPDDYVGRVNLINGKVYAEQFGPDEYVGRSHENGHIYRHAPVDFDDYVGKVIGSDNFAAGGAALLLFFLVEK